MPTLRDVVHAVRIYLAGPHTYPGMIAELCMGGEVMCFISKEIKLP